MGHYMLDTNVFNDLVKGLCTLEDIIKKLNDQDTTFYITHIQKDEINCTADMELRDKLLKCMKDLNTTSLLTETTIIGISRIGECKISNGATYQSILGNLNAKKIKENNPNDALIAETAIENNYVLITADKNLLDAIREFGYNKVQNIRL